MNTQARAEFLAVGNAIGQRILEITANVVVRLHGDDVRAIGEQQQVIGNLEVMGPGKVSSGEEADRFQFARIGRIQDRDSVAEHVADIKMPAVEHHLNAVGPAANIAVREMTEALSDALRRNGVILRVRLQGAGRQCRETQQTFSAIAPSDGRHVLTSQPAYVEPARHGEGDQGSTRGRLLTDRFQGRSALLDAGTGP